MANWEKLLEVELKFNRMRIRGRKKRVEPDKSGKEQIKEEGAEGTDFRRGEAMIWALKEHDRRGGSSKLWR